MYNPIGFSMDKPCLSWIVEAPEAKTLMASKVQVAADECFRNIVFDSGKSNGIDSIGFTPDIVLKPRTRYYWKVTEWTDAGEITSPSAWFETSKMEEPWKAIWITPDWEDKTIHPLFRKGFVLNGEIVSARVYVCGLGLYELEINGSRVCDEYLAPFCNAYDKWIQYQTYDVTAMLKSGDNSLGARLGNGWYKGRFGFDGHNENIYGDSFAFLCELMVEYADGSSVTILSDGSWKAAPGPVIDSNIYDGEIQDAGKSIVGWSHPGFEDSRWSGVKATDIGFDRLEARRSIPVRIMEERKPVKVIRTPKGETVLDMGQNMVGWMRFRADAPTGTEIYLQYGEEMQEGCFYRENLRTAKAEFRYICDGKPAVVQPHFTFYGFRYVKVEGWPGEIDTDDFTGCVVYSDMEPTGNIETSNPLVNRLFLNALWGQKGNFLDVPTDCPQRDERMGWTGDAQVFSGTACFNMDVDAFFHKFLYDLAKEQKEKGGLVTNVVPTFGMGKGDGNGFKAGGSCVWGDAATIIPWNVYLHYGDKAILEQQFDSMRAWVDYIHAQDDGSRLWNKGFHFGDWLALDGPSPFSPMGGTSTDLIASIFYMYSAGIVAKAAAVLGNSDIAAKYGQLADEVKEAIRQEFLSARGRMTIDTQTAYVLALFFDLMPEQFRSRVADTLRQKLADSNYHLKTGFVGTPYLCRALSENGYNDLAYTLLMNDDYPSWLYEVKMGATTIWERWNSLLPNGKFGELGMNSLNHYAYGAIVEWMYRNMCGINPLEEHPGFRKIRLAPQPDGRLQWAKAALETTAGRYESSWQIEKQGLHFEFHIPFNASAELVLPDACLDDVHVNGTAITASGLSAKQMGTNVAAVLPAGQYSIKYVPVKEYIITFSIQNSIQQLMSHSKARAVLEKHIPQMVERAAGGGLMMMSGSAPLCEMAKHPMAFIAQDVLDIINEELKPLKGWD